MASRGSVGLTAVCMDDSKKIIQQENNELQKPTRKLLPLSLGEVLPANLPENSGEEYGSFLFCRMPASSSSWKAFCPEVKAYAL